MHQVSSTYGNRSSANEDHRRDTESPAFHSSLQCSMKFQPCDCSGLTSNMCNAMPITLPSDLLSGLSLARKVRSSPAQHLCQRYLSHVAIVAQCAGVCIAAGVKTNLTPCSHLHRRLDNLVNWDIDRAGLRQNNDLRSQSVQTTRRSCSRSTVPFSECESAQQVTGHSLS